jgi:hypothetical protein
MCRIGCIVFVLAALSFPSANASSDPPAKTHIHASATAISHRLRKPARRPSPQEIGRKAGLRIRRDLQRRKKAPAPAHRSAPLSQTRLAQDSPDQPAPVETLPIARRTLPIEEASSSPAWPAATSQPASLRRVRLQAAAPMRGSFPSLVRQNEKLEAEGLERIEDERDLSSRIAHRLLVPLPASPALLVNPGLAQHHRYCRPWTARFLADLARGHEARFHRPLEVSSAVRTVQYQKQLRQINGNAAPAEGDIVSPHLTGATIDIAKEGMNGQQVAWMRRWLLPLEEAGKIDVAEEFQQACFHITVYRTYAQSRSASRAKAASSPSGPRRTRPAAPASEPAMVAGATAQGQ